MLIFKSFLPEIFFFFCILYQLIINIKFLKNFKNFVPVINEELFLQGIFISLCLIILFYNQKIVGYSNNFLIIIDNSSLNLKFLVSFFFFFIFYFVLAQFCYSKNKLF